MIRKWDKQQVIQAIQARARQGLTLAGVWRQDQSLYRAAQTYCGSWQNALGAAGLPQPAHRRWSPERVIKELQAWHRTPPGADDGWDHGLGYAASRYFGSWTQALQAAGLERRRHRKWSRQRVIDAIQDRHVRGLPVDRLERAHRPLVMAARTYFGGWKQALDAAGLGQHYRSTRPPRARSPSFVVREIQSLHQQGVPVKHIWRVDPTLYSAAKKQFGSWRAAVRAAGFAPGRVRWNRPAIVRELQVRHQRGQSLSSSTPSNRNLVATAIHHFGTWRAALRAAGLSGIERKRHVTGRNHPPDRAARS